VEVLRDTGPSTRPPNGSAVAIGVFDGVHLGHRHVLTEARRLAAEHGAQSAVVTFDRHPAVLVRPESAPQLLTDLDQRLELLESCGVDTTFVVTFDEARSKESAEDFVQTVLVDRLAARAVIVGADFHFGHQRRGNVELLRSMGRDLGFEVDGIELLASKAAGAKVVSSTAIRAALRDGELADANRMLGRPHEVRGDARADGTVVVPADICLPADGSYSGSVTGPAGDVGAAAITVGPVPRVVVEPWDGVEGPARVRFVEARRTSGP
jgi:riboflavin kinase/FMN adenylyltransferase